MSKRTNTFLRLESLEGRELMAASPFSTLAGNIGPVSQPALHSTLASQPMTVDYGDSLKSATPATSGVEKTAAATLNSAFSILNNTNFNLTFSIRWENTNGTWSSWGTYTLLAHYRGEYSYSAVGYTSGCLVNGPVGLPAQIYFATSTHGTTQTDNLVSSVVSGTPSIGAGVHYEFLPTSSTTLNLYQGG